MDEIYEQVMCVCAISYTAEFSLKYSCDICWYYRCPQNLAEICRNMGICCSFRAKAVKEKYSRFILIQNIIDVMINHNLNIEITTDAAFHYFQFMKTWICQSGWAGCLCVLCIQRRCHTSLSIGRGSAVLGLLPWNNNIVTCSQTPSNESNGVIPFCVHLNTIKVIKCSV